MQFARPTRYLPLRLSPLAACTAAALALACTGPAHGHASSPSPAQSMFSLPDGHEASGLLERLALRHAAAPKAARARPLQPSTVPVTSCADDGGNDTLRHAALVANSGDIVDLSGLTCSTITLEAGAISIAVDDLTFKGPGRDRLTIDGHGTDRVFKQTTAGTLAIEDLTISHGHYEAANAYGGCIYAKGSVVLTRAAVNFCAAVGTGKAAGGAIVAFGNLTMYSSEVAGNTASATVGQSGMLAAAAGGVLVPGQLEMHGSSLSGNTSVAALGKAYCGAALASDLTAKYSTFSGNQAVATTADSYNYSVAGGLAGEASMFLIDTTIDTNTADLAGGAFVGAGGFATVVQSTISANVGNLAVGGIASTSDLSMLGSTVAFNVGGHFGGGGVVLGSGNLSLESSILADNAPSDFDGTPAVTGSHNLVKVLGPQSTPMPADTITLDPALGPLVNNGGGTRTHAILAGSVAIDAGSGGNNNLETDQRGIGFTRPVGAAQDIGAFEYDSDRIMTNGCD